MPLGLSNNDFIPYTLFIVIDKTFFIVLTTKVVITICPFYSLIGATETRHNEKNYGIILIVIKVKINVLLAGPLLVLVYLVPIVLRRMLAKVLISLGMGALIILLIITLR